MTKLRRACLQFSKLCFDNSLQLQDTRHDLQVILVPDEGNRLFVVKTHMEKYCAYIYYSES